jgi:hypothetical protein
MTVVDTPTETGAVAVSIGYDSSQVDDETMGKLADAMEGVYYDFFDDLWECANRLAVPKRGDG